ncbi:GSCOCG00007957001-RA-CDS, partial [Cotesia congregata]
LVQVRRGQRRWVGLPALYRHQLDAVGLAVARRAREQEPQPVVPTSQTPPASAATSDGSVTLSVTEPVRTRRSYSMRPGDLERLPTMNLSPAPVNLLHPASDVSYDEDTSSTSGYRESYSIQLVTIEGREAHPPPLASPDLNEPSTSSTTTNMVFDGSSPDGSLNGNNPGGEKAALLSSRQHTASQHSLLMVFQPQDEDTLI